MLIGGGEGELQAWKTDMLQYEKAKRTKKPFGPSFPTVSHVTYKEVKTQQTQFNPVLQTFKHPQAEEASNRREEQRRAHSLMNQFKHTQKYQKPYDIINLYSGGPLPAPQEKHHLTEPLRNNFNIVSNQPLPDFYLRSKELRIPNKPQRKNLHNNLREFDIITGNYKENNEEKQQREQMQIKSLTEEKYWRNHDYNPVIGTYYDMNKEEHYQEELDKQMKQHGRDAQRKLPPSYIHRERFIADPTKQVPEEVRQLQEKDRNAKRRYQMRYLVEKEYGQRNVEHDLKQQAILRNRIHDGKVIEDQKKQFNIVTLKNYDMQRKLEMFGKQPITSTWDKITRLKGTSEPEVTGTGRFAIKTSGFS